MRVCVGELIDACLICVKSATTGTDDAEQDRGGDSAHPRFAEARHAHIDALVGLFAGNRFVTRMMGDAGVITLRGLLAGFRAAYDENDRTTWATPGPDNGSALAPTRAPDKFR
ncbi:hypothetical protein SAMN05444161_7952 [Rhizobiales bacterium GAS191]|nr:hypothetical protein SAMN05444161_7952 [Rhizobiales bacterium GAS191]